MYAARNLSKSYGGVTALDGVDLDINAGEVHALLGANGAGKSTLVKILVGAAEPSQGTLTLDGEPVSFTNVGEAAAQGVAIVSQELNLFPGLDVLSNLFLQREPLAAGISIDRRAMRRRAQPVIDAIALAVDLDRPLGSLNLGEQQLVEIARALIDDPKILFLDEPTSALQAAETERLLEVVRRLRDRGVAVVYVSHFLEDVFAVADRITILRNGRVAVARRPRAEMTIAEAVAEMLGRPSGTAAPERVAVADPRPGDHAPGSGRPLTLSGVAIDGALEPLDLEARPGEVVGLAGLEGSGVGAVFDLIFGRRRPDAGTISLPGTRRAPGSMAQAVRAGVAYVPADRKRLGLMLEAGVAENVTTVSGGPLRRMGVVLRARAMRGRAEHWGSVLGIAMASPATRAGALSGGNQQKVVFAKWLEADPTVVLLDDPSRGVDIGAKRDMHTIIAQIAARGRVVLYTSSDLEEMAAVCDRVLVFFGARVVGQLPRAELTEHRLLEAINLGRMQ